MDFASELALDLDEDEETFEEALKEDLLSKLDNDMTIKVNGSAISLGDYAIKQSDYARKQIQEMVKRQKYYAVNMEKYQYQYLRTENQPLNQR